MVRECSMSEGKEKRTGKLNKRPEGNTQPGKSKHRWKNNTKIFLKETQY
jgi:hypothetical protein